MHDYSSKLQVMIDNTNEKSPFKNSSRLISCENGKKTQYVYIVYFKTAFLGGVFFLDLSNTRNSSGCTPKEIKCNCTLC